MLQVCVPTSAVAAATFLNEHFRAADDTAVAGATVATAAPAPALPHRIHANDATTATQKVLVSARKSQASAAVMTLQEWWGGSDSM